ncbi:MAG: superoxide dismutase family protein [Bacillota bacterium]|uniref:Superoxide dismutase [Cu-Zn] n=1 Tax=Virgibacillus salarius TaxID=447199 RepID=A0A941DXJ6_9BACI|nr:MULTISPECIES: superoxide dismutase family protein [Bacillaceae]MBR7797142.1 superoxide dismutase family protein [Virgibacillus salarius]MDY7045563.1 superoxide dismutase family protein [Virgibacillus sp. M23]NAZ09851.1 superoxide dismutase family protein [Agaribacter marinus]
MKRSYAILIFGLVLLLLAACNPNNEEQQGNVDKNNEQDQQNEDSPTVGNPDNATAEEEVLVSLKDKDDHVVATATLKQVKSGVHIKLNGENLPPGTHGFHIHETGSCQPPDFKSAGGHFNPGQTKHGKKHPEGPHAGDLPNIEVGEDGTVNTETTAELVTLKKGKDNSLYKEGGTALVIHAGADDYISQPSGDAGDRIACGVIAE